MPMISSTATATPSPQKTEIKPIGICLSSNSNIELPTVVPSTVASISANSRNPANATNSNSFYPNTTVSTSGQFQMGPLSVMVAKFTSNPSISSNRQQTVILQPRINTTRATALQMNPIRGSAIISQNNSNPLTSATQPISVRTRVLSGQAHQNNAVPVLNLSTVTNAVSSSNSSTTNTVKQTVIKGQKFIATTSNLETVNLVMTTPNDRNIRTNSVNNELKANTMLTVQHINNIKGPKTVLPSSTIVAQPKMISINNTGTPNVMNCQRLGFLGTSVGGNKSGIIINNNLPTKSFIFTSPSATLTGSGATIANMVSISSANLVQPGQATKINVTPNHINIAATTRHSATSANALIQNNLLSPKATIYTVATTSANVFNSVSSLPTTTISTIQQAVSYNQSIATTTVTISSAAISTASLVNTKPTILAANLSPVKPSLQTPNSPRPRILSRKRLQSDSPTIAVKTANGSICNSTINMIEAKPQLPILNNCSENQPMNIIIKTELAATNISNATSDTNLTPRKKPRKQLLEPSSPKKEIEDDQPAIKESETERDSKELIIQQQPTIVLRKPRPLLYLYNHKDAGRAPHHFLRHTDVKQKQDKKVSITDLLSDVQKQNVGWKINHIAEQLKRSSDEEICTLQGRLENFLKVLESEISPFSSCASNTTLFGDSSSAEKIDIVDKICVKINDLTRANIQRTKLILDHYNDSKQLLHKLSTDHKEKVTNLAKRIGHKRGYVK